MGGLESLSPEMLAKLLLIDNLTLHHVVDVVAYRITLGVVLVDRLLGGDDILTDNLVLVGHVILEVLLRVARHLLHFGQ